MQQNPEQTSSHYEPKIANKRSWVPFSIWLILVPTLAFWPHSFDSTTILLFSIIVVLLAAYGLSLEAFSGIQNLFSLLNALWLCLLIYALPLYVISSLYDTSILIPLEPRALADGARLTFISIAVSGFSVELMRSWGSAIHRKSIFLIAQARESRQFYFAIFLTILYLVNFVNSGVINILSSGNRFAITQAFENAENGKMWLIQYLMTGVSIAFIYQYLLKPQTRKLSYYMGYSSIVIFWLLFLCLGNRRGMISVVISAVVCFIARSKNSRKPIILLFFAFIISGAIGVFRQDTSSVSIDQVSLINITNFFGEFFYPGFTLVETIAQRNEPSLDFTWVTMPLSLISSQIQGNPFEFLGQRFAQDFAQAGSEVMGFAYLPIT